MAPLERLRLALAAAPVGQPCTAEAVDTLYTAAYAAVRQVAPLDRSLLPPVDIQEASVQEHVPTACMPVLGWLANGLSSGLPPAATKQAYELACAMLGVVYRQLPWSIQDKLWAGPDLAITVKMIADSLLQRLGARELVFQQLVQVLTALLAATFPGSAPGIGTSTSSSAGASSSSSSSRPGVPLQQLAAFALAWEQMCGFMTSFGLASDPGAVAQSLKTTGLLQLLLEGTLVLLGTAPEAPPTAEHEQLLLWDTMKSAAMAASFLTSALGSTICNVWWIMHERTMPGGGPLPPGLQWDPEPGSSAYEPWMQPMLKLHLLLLAKLQWDMRQCPDAVQVATPNTEEEARLRTALARAVPGMVSPCVAGDLLQQRAPGLLPHRRRCKRQLPTRNGRRREVVEESIIKQPSTLLSSFLNSVNCCRLACRHDGRTFDALDAQDLALLLEATELCCLVCPSDVNNVVSKTVTVAYLYIVDISYPVLTSFAATCGEALISIAEYLVEDVLLVSSGAAPQPADLSTTTTTSSSSSSSGSRGQLRAGGDNPAVTLEHRVAWAQGTLESLAALMSHQVPGDTPLDGGGYWEAAGYGAGVVHGLMTSTTAPRLLRLMEACYRVPLLLDMCRHDLLYVLPTALPALHVAASSPKGSRTFLAAITTAAKWQQAANCILDQLVKADGQLAPAAVGVGAAVPGPIGAQMAEQLEQGKPQEVVKQAVEEGLHMVDLASKLFARAAGLLDPKLTPLAAYLAASKLPPGQNSKPWAVEAAVNWNLVQTNDAGGYAYSRLLVRSPEQVADVNRRLALALAAQHAAATRYQAVKASQAGGSAAEARQLRHQLQDLWLGRGQGVLAGLNVAGRSALLMRPASRSTPTAPAGNGSSSGGGSDEVHALNVLHHDIPGTTAVLLEFGVPVVEVAAAAAAGNLAEWATVFNPISEEDRRVAATALLAACKAAGSVAQLPLLVRELQPVLEQQPWCRDMAKGQWGQHLLSSDILTDFVDVAIWAMLLAPVLGLLLPADKAAQLQGIATGATDSLEALEATLTGDKVMQLLGLLGQVVGPGAPGCCYPGCCNLEGRSEGDLPLQLCTGCKGVRYCCREHQVAHWKAGHKEVCRVTQAAVKQVVVAGQGQNTAAAGNGADAQQL